MALAVVIGFAALVVFLIWLAARSSKKGTATVKSKPGSAPAQEPAPVTEELTAKLRGSGDLSEAEFGTVMGQLFGRPAQSDEPPAAHE